MIRFITASFILAASVLSIPHTPKSTQIELRFGIPIVDNYKWMENLSDFRLSSWIQEQNNYTKENLNLNTYNELYAEFLELYTPKPSSQPESLNSEIDDNNFMNNRIFKKEGRRFNPNDQQVTERKLESEKYILEVANETGEDYQRLNIFKAMTDDSGNKVKSELVQTLHVSRSRVLFWKDSDTFYYSTAGHHRAGDTHYKVLLHKVSTNQADDKVIYRAPTATTWFYFSQDQNKRDLLLEGNLSDLTEVYGFDFQKGKQDLLFSIKGEHFDTIQNEDESMDYLSIVHTKKSPLGKIVKLNSITHLTTTIIPQQNVLISEAVKFGDDYIITSEHGGSASLYYYNLNRKEMSLIELPQNGWLSISNMKKDQFSVRYSGANKYRAIYNVKVNDLTVTLNSTVDASTIDSEIEVKRELYNASTGQKANLWIVKLKETKLSPTTPTFMYGYGGFKVNNTLYYQKSLLPWLKRGGVYVHVTLPGGMEYGLDWFNQGAGLNKHGTFDSFANAAKYLIKNDYTSANHLAIGGTSNGGLLASATAMLYPELFKATVPNVGVHDLLNYQLHANGKWWFGNYGNYFNEADFMYFKDLSPYHNISPLKSYPSTLVTTAMFDDRVVPWHSYKLTAKLQEFYPNENIYLHTKSWGSHSSRSSSVKQRAEQSAMKWAFLIKELMD